MNKQSHHISVSVIVPVYNVEQYLYTCLTSLVSQSKPFDEIILVNDGSTDNSKTICEEFSKKYSNIVLLNQDNYGQSVARNRGLEYANGEYIVFVDADDYIVGHLNMCIYNNLKDSNVDMLCYQAECLNELGPEYNNISYKDGYLGDKVMSGIEYLEKKFDKQYNVVVYLAAFKRSFLKEFQILFPEGLYYEDNVFFLQAVLYAGSVKCIPECLYIRRFRPDSTMTGSMTEKKALDIIEIQQIVGEKLYLYPYKNNHKTFFKRFLSNRILVPFGYLCSVKITPVIQKSIEEMVFSFIDEWHLLYAEEKLNWNDIYALQYISSYIASDRTGRFDELLVIIEKALNEKLGGLQLNDSKKKIGIYGIGKAAEQLCKIYEKYIGTIRCDIIYIVTQKNSDSYKGKPLFNCEEVPDDLDFIIISSLLYGTEMKQELEKKGIDPKKIKDIYTKNDKFDLSQMNMLTE